MFTGLLRVDSPDGLATVSIPSRTDDLINLVRAAGAEICEGAEFNHPESGVFIEDETSSALTFVKRDARWKVEANTTHYSDDVLLYTLLHPQG